jgi:NitT/TauT family transport system substrate-binding protein
MKRTSQLAVLAIVAIGLALTGCPGPSQGPSGTGGGGAPAPADVPSFSLAWSEYPSWSTFGVADEEGLVDGDKGKLGPVEEKWNVDIVLKEADYDPCIQMYATGACDAVCMTNMDALNPALSRPSVAILPTSTSIGADACIVVDIDDVKRLREHKVYGLAKSVSEYCFVRNLELLGEKEEDHKFTNMDPGAAALAMQTGQTDQKAIVVWNPYVLQTLSTTPGTKVLFDSSTIPEEIIDMVVVTKEALDKPGGKEFACAVIETFYELNKMLEDPATGDDTLVALGAKFSDLGLEEMTKVVEQTKFYSTPEAGLELFGGGGFFTDQKFTETMEMVVDFCTTHEIVTEKPTIFFGPAADAGDAQLIFDPSYIEAVQEKMAP